LKPGKLQSDPTIPSRGNIDSNENSYHGHPETESRSAELLAAIGAKGGKTVTPKKRAHLSKISSKGGKSLIPKKLAQVRAMWEKRWAKPRAEREAK